MDKFDFIISFISIVYGLALTTFLSRSVGLIIRRASVKWYLPHIIWCFNWYCYMLFDWWFTFYWSNEKITYPVYTFFYLKASIMVVISYLLTPASKSTRDMDEYFQSVKTILFPLLGVFVFFDLADTLLHGVEVWLRMPALYFIRIGITVALCITIALVQNKKVQLALSVIGFLIGWSTTMQLALT